MHHIALAFFTISTVFEFEVRINLPKITCALYRSYPVIKRLDNFSNICTAYKRH